MTENERKPVGLYKLGKDLGSGITRTGKRMGQMTDNPPKNLEKLGRNTGESLKNFINKGKGWHNQPTRHSLASKGVKTTKDEKINKKSLSSDSTTIDWKPYRQIFVNEEGDIGYGHKSDFYQSNFEFFFDRNDSVKKEKIKIPNTDDILQTELHKVDDSDLIQIGKSEYLLVNFLKILEDIKGEQILYKNTNKILKDWRRKEFEFTIHYSDDERDYPILVEDENNDDYYYSIAPFIKED